MKKVALIIIVVLIQRNLTGQVQPANIIFNENYLINPSLYLSPLDVSKIKSNILIDKTIYNDIILNVNGIDKVTSITCNQWGEIYNQLRSASYDTIILPDPDTIRKIINSYYNQKIYAIGLIDFQFQKIKKTAIDNGEFILGNDFIAENNTSINSYDNNRAFISGNLSHSIYGDNIRFVVPEELYFKNNNDYEFQSIEIDFGNGVGFRNVNFNEIITVPYNSISGYVEIIIKLTLKKMTSNETEVVYSRSSVLRKMENNLSSVINTTNSRSVPDLKENYYPESTTYFYDPLSHQYILDISNSKIEYQILYSSQNLGRQQLRRPFIICDGFDPGDKRDFYQTYHDAFDELLPKDQDARGLYDLLNGDPSPWYPNESSPNLVDKLLQNGYDIIFVNFLDGAGDIPSNANYFRSFLNNVINNSLYRDNKTEEITMVGPSMGGLITRYMLTTMENAGEEHFVKQWISFDSPHKGAYIPLGLQHSIDFMSLIPVVKNSFLEGKEKINSVAAKQLLLYHYTQTSIMGNSTSLFNSLYTELDQLGYPKYSKNYAISNGGTQKLYSDNGSKILDLKIPFIKLGAEAWGNHNNDGIYLLMLGNYFAAPFPKITHSQTAFENAPGGWNSALYTINYDKKNKSEIPDNSIEYTKSSFIITTSAFGIPITRDNVHNTWESYTNCNDNSSGKIKTAFDVIKGMEIENEEHVRISNSTGNYVADILKIDINNLELPRQREGQVLNQKVSGKVAYNAISSLKLGGNNNTLTIKEGADVTASSENIMTFYPGFSVENGAKFNAKIQSINYGTMLKNHSITTNSIDYGASSPFSDKMYNYSNNIEIKNTSNHNQLHIFPNPSTGKFTISTGDNLLQKIEVIDKLGQEIMMIEKPSNDTVIDLTEYPSGMYFVKVQEEGKVSTMKIIKN